MKGLEIEAVYADGVLLRQTTYRLAIWGEGDTERAVAIDGHIDITGMAEAIVLAGPDTLTLEVEDGRRLPFSLTSSGGRIVGRGNLELLRS